MQDTWIRSRYREDSLEKEMASHSVGILAWRIPWTEEPGRLQSMGSQESDMMEWLSVHTDFYHFIPPVKKLISVDTEIKWGTLLCSLDDGVFILPLQFYFSDASIFALVTFQDPCPLWEQEEKEKVESWWWWCFKTIVFSICHHNRLFALCDLHSET